MNSKKFDILILKNTIAIVIPALAVFLVLIFMLGRYPVFEKIRCKELKGSENVTKRVGELYDNGEYNVLYTANNLTYTGFDYLVDGRIEGAYYYIMYGSNMQLFLVSTENPKDEIDSVTIRGRILKDNLTAEHIVNQFAEANNIEFDMLRGFCSDYIISEPNYPRAFITMVYVMIASPIIVGVILMFYSMLIIINPSMHPQARQLEIYGEPIEIIDEINQQLKNQLVYKKNNVYITRDYMIVSYLSRTDVIRLDYIKYMSKNEIEDNRRRKNKKKHGNGYRLTMSNPEKFFYEVDFPDEETIDTAVYNIRN